jgi:ABC-2 type transport system permease protein
MLTAIASFELKSRLKQLSTLVYFLLFFALAFLMILAAGGAFKGATVSFFGGKLNVNSPFVLNQTLTFLGYFGLLVVSAVMGRAVQKDFEHEIHPFFFTSPLTKLQYLGGRFLGALLTVMAIFASIGLGAFLATKAPWVRPDRLGPDVGWAILQPYAVSLLPNVLFTGACFFGLAALTRKMFPVYVTSVMLLIAYLIGLNLLGDLDNKPLAALLDPFGLVAMDQITEYWTVSERNSRLVPLQGVFLANRLLWLGWAPGCSRSPRGASRSLTASPGEGAPRLRRCGSRTGPTRCARWAASPPSRRTPRGPWRWSPGSRGWAFGRR